MSCRSRLRVDASRGHQNVFTPLLIENFQLFFGLLPWRQKRRCPGMMVHAGPAAFSGAILQMLKQSVFMRLPSVCKVVDASAKASV
jgi:hypothetical protein